MSFETFTDRSGRIYTPRKGTLVVHHYANFGGTMSSGLIYKGPEHLPTVFGVVVAIRHDCAFCVLNLDRDRGGIMPGDLVHFARYVTGRDAEYNGQQVGINYIADIALLAPADRYDEETRKWRQIDVETIEPVYGLAEDAVMGRIDDVIEDPWAAALAELPQPDTLIAATH